MLFTTYRYALFVGAALCAYYLFARFSRGRHAQNLVLVVLSYAFYAAWDWRWCLLLAGVTATGFVGGVLLDRSPAHRRLILVLILVLDLFTLGVFKYFRFFADSFASLLRGVGLHPDWVTLNLVLPIGISYYVFQNLSYVIDVYRRDLAATAGVVEYATALSFFPQLLAGPITRPRAPAAATLRAPRLRRPACPRRAAPDPVGTNQEDAHRRQHRRAGRLRVVEYRPGRRSRAGHRRPCCTPSRSTATSPGTPISPSARPSSSTCVSSKNFDYPYFSTSVRMFWRRWHITLASWMRDYVYIPLGGNRVGPTAPGLQRARHLPAGRPLARRQLDVRGLGPAPRLVPVVESQLRAGRQRTANARTRSWLAVVVAVVVFALVTVRLGVLPSAVDERCNRVLRPRFFAVPLGAVDHLRYVPYLALSAAPARSTSGSRGAGSMASPSQWLPLPVRWVVVSGACAWRSCCSATWAAVRGSMSSSRRGAISFLLRVAVFVLRVHRWWPKCGCAPSTPASEAPLYHQDTGPMIYQVRPARSTRRPVHGRASRTNEVVEWRVNNDGWNSAVDYQPAAELNRSL